MKEYSFMQKFAYHNKRKKELQKKPPSKRTEKENKQLHDSIGFITGASYETQKDMDSFKKGVERGKNAVLWDSKSKKKGGD